MFVRSFVVVANETMNDSVVRCVGVRVACLFSRFSDVCHQFSVVFIHFQLWVQLFFSYFSATFQLLFPHSLRVFLKNVKCCFGFLFEKMSKLRGVENAHTWRHMVRLTRRSTSGSLG